MKPKLRWVPIFVLFFSIPARTTPFLSAVPQKDNQIGLWKKIPNAPLAVPNSRIGKELVGNKLVVWGGEKSDKPLSDGAVYDIDTNVWKKMAPAPMEGAEHGTMLAYGKNEVIIWGGTPNGAIYHVEKETWKKMAAAPITLGAEPYTSGLLGNKLFVWGIGKTRDLNPVGGIYDIDKDTWKKIAEPATIKAIDDWPPLFYKNKFIVWGAPSAVKSDRYGAIYDIDKDEWKEMAKAPIERRNWSAAVLSGNKLIIWGGCPGPVEAHSRESFADGAVYDIDKDTWKMMPAAPLKARFLPRSFIWGKKVLIWGGFKDEFYYDGAIYDVEKDAWEKIPDAPLVGIGVRGRELYNYGIFGYNPTPPNLVGDKLVVWGGEGTVVGAIFDLKNGKWEEITAAPIGGRDYHASFIYRNKLIIWGGVDAKGAQADGAIYTLGK
jgi:N-acetylneuraminic acid mutarotase